MRIIVNNEVLDILDDTIRFEKVSDFFEFNQSSSDYSFPFIVPATDKNNRILGFLNNPDTINRKLSIPCYVDYEGINSFSAILVINSFTSKRYNITIKSGVNTLSTSKKLLTELNLGGDFFLGADNDAIAEKVAEINGTENWADYGFCFPPIYAPNFYQDSDNTSFCGVINRVNSDTGLPLYNSVTAINVYTMVPLFYVFWILNKIALEEGLRLEGEFISDPEFAKLLVTNMQSLDAPSQTSQALVRTFSSQIFNDVTEHVQLRSDIPNTNDNAGAWSNSLYEYEFLVEGHYSINVTLKYHKTHTNAQGVAYLKVSGGTSLGSDVVPSFLIAGAQRTITFSVLFYVPTAYLGRKLYVEFENPVSTPGEIVVDSDSSMFIENLELSGLNVYTTSLNPINHLQPISVNDFLLSLKKQFNLIWDIDKTRGIFKIDFSEENTGSVETEDITNLVSPDVEVFVENIEKNYFLKFETTDLEFKDFDVSKITGFYRTPSVFPTPKYSGELVCLLTTNKVYIAVNSGTTLIWQEHTNLFNGYSTGDVNQEEILLDYSPVEMCYENNVNTSFVHTPAIMPYIQDKGSSAMFGLGANEHKPRFVFLRGLNNPTGSDIGGQYLLASTGCYTINGYAVGRRSLVIYSEFGLLESLFKNTIAILISQEVHERAIFLNAPMLLSMSKTKRYLINNIPYKYKSISIPFSKRLLPGIIRLIKS